MKLIAVRHGETEWNRERRDMGQLDSPLTTRGVRQAEALAGSFIWTHLFLIFIFDRFLLLLSGLLHLNPGGIESPSLVFV